MSSQDLTLSFDDILAAVKETARGRWFVESLESRTRTGNTTRILESISRLEDRIEHFGINGEDAALVRKAREAIAAARRDIAQLENRPANLSSEAQLFARLAAQAKQAFGQNGSQGQTISRALTLIEDLDREFNPPAQGTAEAPGVPAAITFFQPDEAIFEAAPTIQSVPVPASGPEQAKELGGRGAKVVIHKLGTVEAAPAPVVAGAEPAAPPVAAEAPETEKQAEPAHGRIVLVRRQPGEAADVPLLEDSQDSAA